MIEEKKKWKTISKNLDIKTKIVLRNFWTKLFTSRENWGALGNDMTSSTSFPDSDICVPLSWFLPYGASYLHYFFA